MTLPTRDVTLTIYDEGDAENVTESKFSVDPRDIAYVDIQARARDRMDEAEFVLHDNHGRYAGEDYIDQGDRVEVEIPLTEGSVYGDGFYSRGRYGAQRPITWVGRVLNDDRNQPQPGISELTFSATDYVGDILSDRTVTNAYVDDDVGEIVRDMVERQASEVDADRVPDFDITTDVSYSSADLWDVVNQLAARADALPRHDGTDLIFDPLDNLDHTFELGQHDYFLPWTTSTDVDIKNTVRVDSGKSRAEEHDQSDVDDFVEVSEDQREITRLRARKAEVHSVELFVRRGDGDNDLSVRLQSDEGGEPVAIDDYDSDLTDARWQADNLPADGPQSFFFDEHTLPDRDPWLIIEGGGEEPHEVGVTAGGDIAYTSYYPHQINFEVTSQASEERYGTRDIQIERDNLETLVATRDAARAELAKRAWPTKTIEFEAQSSRAHALRPGETVTVDKPDEDAVGDFVVTENETVFDGEGINMHSYITAEWRRGILDPEIAAGTAE